MVQLIDPSILLRQAQIQLPDPVEQATQALTLGELARRKRANAAADMDAERQRRVLALLEQARPGVLRGGYSDADIANAPPEVQAALMAEATKYRKDRREEAKLDSDTRNTESQILERQYKLAGGNAYELSRRTDLTPQDWAGFQQQASAIGLRLPDPQDMSPQGISAHLRGVANQSLTALDQMREHGTQQRHDESQATIRQGQQMTDSRQRELAAAQRESAAAGRAQAEATRAAARASVQVGPNGELFSVDAGTATGRPITGPDGKQIVRGAPQKPPPEAYAKQVSGITNLNTAIDNYLAKLQGWSNTDLLSPGAISEMGTAYNNMMLQAKEAYNLGVLNGPDYMILTSTITDPRSFKGAITKNDDLGAQAEQLRTVMQRNAENLANVYKQPVPDVAKPRQQEIKGAPAGPKVGEVRDGYEYTGGHPGDPKSWRKVN